MQGSAIGRMYPEEKAAANPHAVLKDLNWVQRHRQLALGPEKKALFEEQLRRDTELLQRLGIMDYSLLTGIHNGIRGNSDGLREDKLSVFQVRLASRFFLSTRLTLYPFDSPTRSRSRGSRRRSSAMPTPQLCARPFSGPTRRRSAASTSCPSTTTRSVACSCSIRTKVGCARRETATRISA